MALITSSTSNNDGGGVIIREFALFAGAPSIVAKLANVRAERNINSCYRVGRELSRHTAHMLWAASSI